MKYRQSRQKWTSLVDAENKASNAEESEWDSFVSWRGLAEASEEEGADFPNKASRELDSFECGLPEEGGLLQKSESNDDSLLVS